MSEGTISFAPLRCSQRPIPTAIGTCTKQGKIVAGYCRKTDAITRPKIARTIVNAMNRIRRNRIRARRLISLPAMSPTVCPLFLIETTSAPKSCTAPMKIDPSKTQTRAGTQPHITAIAGPTIGPVPAIEVKWWPKTTGFDVGT